MKNKNKVLLFVLSLLMFSLISFNTTFIYAETNKTTINFVDEEGDFLEINDTVSIVKLEDQGGTKVPIPVYVKDSKETTDYNNGTPLTELSITNGKLEIEGLTKDNEYLLTFDNDYVFQKTDNNETNYYLFGSFKGGSDTYAYSLDLKLTSELTSEQLEEISGTNNIFTIDDGYLVINVNCGLGGVFWVNNLSGSVQSCTNGVANSSAGGCSDTQTSTSSGSKSYSVTYNGRTSNTYSWVRSSTKNLSCSDFNLPNDAVCNPGVTATCYNGTTVTQTYNANGGSCSKSSDTRTRSNGSKTCSSSYTWGSCSYGSWSGSVSAPSCSKGDTTEYATVSYNGNKGSGSTSVSLSKSSDTISRTVHWNFDGFSNYQTAFTSDTTATANYSVSGYGSWSSATLPSASRVGYTFTGWISGGTTYNAGETIYPGGGKTYTANWDANEYTYTINFVSSTGKLLDTRTETHDFDEVVTISHDPINGYEVEDRNINWDSAEDGYVVTITYQIITYDIEYSLEVGNPRAIANPSSNNENNVLTYNVEDCLIVKII